MCLLQKKYEVQLKLNPQQDGLDQPSRNKTARQKPAEDKTDQKISAKEKSSVVIRGVTFYKAEEDSYAEEADVNIKRKKSTVFSGL